MGDSKIKRTRSRTVGMDKGMLNKWLRRTHLLWDAMNQIPKRRTKVESATAQPVMAKKQALGANYGWASH
eukprot:2445162-Amphidinium_carterae.1